MDEILTVQGLRKQYPGFLLADVHFSLAAGHIMGFIGRNGAGKTTTLKSLLNIVHPDAGEVRFFGKTLAEDELAIKQQLGFVAGGADFYMHTRISAISAVTRRFYQNWDDAAYARCLARFALDERKTPAQLSAGMQVKYALTLALSHRARLLLLDEPTSGLDPVSRDELLDIFLTLAGEGVSILFSTHITSDLDKCADDITYIRGGRIAASQSASGFRDAYRVLDLAPGQENDARLQGVLLGVRRAKTGSTGLVGAQDAARFGLAVRPADLEEIMVHLEKEGEPL